MSEAEDFSFQIDREWAAKVEDVHEFVSLVGLTALRGVVNKSPVDTGRFKGNWNLGIGEVDETTTESTDKDGGPTIVRGDISLQSYGATEGFPVLNVSNSLPYGPRLEDGYSGQAPSGMVGLTVAELEAEFDGQDV